jgi:Protein ENHANCED DISEASE RESISTANCE 2, C-terminal
VHWGGVSGPRTSCSWHAAVSFTETTLLHRFLEGEGAAADKRRNNRFKLIPHILKSPWVVKQAVGTTPVLLGNKLVTKYFRCAVLQAFASWGHCALQ